MKTRIFVFGSNTEGRHGKGAALCAYREHGAVYYQAEGRQGDSYAIPTKRLPYTRLPIEDVAKSVERFLRYANLNLDLEFQVTAIGCGLAGFTVDQIAPLFRSAPAHCVLPKEFTDFLLTVISNQDKL